MSLVSNTQQTIPRRIAIKMIRNSPPISSRSVVDEKGTYKKRRKYRQQNPNTTTSDSKLLIHRKMMKFETCSQGTIETKSSSLSAATTTGGGGSSFFNTAANVHVVSPLGSRSSSRDIEKPSRDIEKPSSNEISLSQATQNLLTNVRISDVTLVGNDGERIIGNKGMLAARSPVFESMLFDDDVTTTTNEVTLEYSGKVVRAVVEYIYSDKASLLERMTDGDDSESDDSDEEALSSTILALIDAASHFALEELCCKALDFATKFIKDHPSQSISWLAECQTRSGTKSGYHIKELVMKQIRQNPKLLLGENDDTNQAMALLSHHHMELILKDQNLRASEYTMFCVLKKWANVAYPPEDNDIDDNDNDNDDNQEDHTNIMKHNHEIVTDDEIDDIVDASVYGSETNTNEMRRAQRLSDARELSEHIALHLIDPEDLNHFVATSGIITEKQLLQAYREQCESLSRKIGVSFKSRYRAGMEGFSFKNSKHGDLHLSDGKMGWKTDVVVCPPLTQGNIYQWGMYVEEFVSTGDGLHLGVASTMNHHQLQFDKFLGFQDGGWTLCNKGYTYESNESVLRRDPKRCFGRGATLVFTLDLTSRGSMSVSINGNKSLALCENMFNKRIKNDNTARSPNRRCPKAMRNNKKIGFIPAVSTRVHGGRGIARVRFLGFE